MECGIPVLSIEGKVATIALRRPSQANRLGPDDLVALQAHIQAVNENPQVQVLRLQSAGKYFCSGYDISKLGGERPVDFETVANLLESARPVTVAVIHGGVYGGGTDLALACDFRLGARGIDMFMPASRLGLHFYGSGMQRYVSRLGLNAAKRLFLAAERIDAEEMQRIGFLTHLAEADALPVLTKDLATTLSAMAPLALIGMKKHLNRIARHQLDAQDLKRDLDRVGASRDLQEGRAAWLEKRSPHFEGR